MRNCIFCSQNIREIDFRDTSIIKRFTSSQSKIIDPGHTGTCASHQRQLSVAIKRARIMGLLPFLKR